MPTDWFGWALLSTVCNGARAFVAKKAVHDRFDTAVLGILAPAVMVVFAIPLLWTEREPLASDLPLMVTAACTQGLLFFLANQTRLEALEQGTPAHVVFPIVQFSTPIIVFISALMFEEWRTLRDPTRLTGVLLALAATQMLVQWRSGRAGWSRGVVLALVSMGASVGATLAAKFAFVEGTSVSIYGFILISNVINLLLATGRALLLPAPGTERALVRGGIVWGALIGVFNFVGFAAFLLAIQRGPLSLVAAITALSTLIPILLASWLYGEELTLQKHLALFASVIALVLLARG